MKIKRIVIKGASGYGPIDEAYEDKLTITENSIAYEYKPHPQSKLEMNIYRKWSYKTTSPIFQNIYEHVAEMTSGYLYNDDILLATDVGPIDIIVTFEDDHKEKANYFCSSEYFQDWFLLIKKMVPECEYVPAVLITEEDYIE